MYICMYFSRWVPFSVLRFNWFWLSRVCTCICHYTTVSTCMYVCVIVYVCACIYMYIIVIIVQYLYSSTLFRYACIILYMRLFLHDCMPASMYVCTCHIVYICMYIGMYVRVYECLFMCMLVYLHIRCMYVSKHWYACMYTLYNIQSVHAGIPMHKNTY